MLAIHVLNAGRGDSIVLEHTGEDGRRSFAVVDSNSAPGETPPALRKLRALNADRLSFVALTHPHSDHYSGLAEVLDAFEGRIDGIFSFPLERDRNRLNAVIATYEKVVRNGTAIKSVRQQTLDMVRFLKSARGHANWEAPSGLNGILAVAGFEGVSWTQVLPPSRVKGRFFQGIDEGKLEIESPEANDLSLAIALEYGGVRVLLGADGERGNWHRQSRLAELANTSITADAVKLPHHGSAEDSDESVIDRVFRASSGRVERVALISAVGNTHHPSADVLKALMARGIKPYCTNLAPVCASRRVDPARIPIGDLAPSLARLVESVASKDQPGAKRPCQGEISYYISPTGTVSIQREIRNPCYFRGDYSGLRVQNLTPVVGP